MHRRPPAKVLLALVSIALMPFPVVLADFSPGVPYGRAAVFPVELAMLGLAVACRRAVWRSLRRRTLGAGATGWLLLAAVMAATWLARPSVQGLLVAADVAAAVALAHVVTLAWRARWPLAAFVGVVAVGEAVWAVAQRGAGRGLGLGGLGEAVDPLHRATGALAPQGSMTDAHVLAGLALVAATMLGVTGLVSRRAAPWILAAGLAVTPVGFTYSAEAALGLTLAGAMLAWSARRSPAGSAVRRRALVLSVALVIGAAVPAAFWNKGWTAPAWGDRHEPVGNLAALAALVAALGALGWRAWRREPVAFAVYLAYLPLLLLDRFPYDLPQGVVLTGLWLGTLDGLARSSPRAMAVGLRSAPTEAASPIRQRRLAAPA